MTDQARTELTIGQAADYLGVTPKALRHWDELGLLVPTWRTWSDYRLYTADDLERGAAIMVYRAAGVRLAEIKTLLDDQPGPHLTAALKTHRAGLVDKRKALERQLESVDALIKRAEQGENVMDDMKKYLSEAEQRWGGTDEWDQSQQVAASYGDQDWADFKKEQESFARDLGAAKEAGVTPGSAEALELVERHRESIGRFYEVPRGRQWVLAQMYTEDQRFSAAYGGNEGYLLELVAKQAELEGITEPSWD